MLDTINIRNNLLLWFPSLIKLKRKIAYCLHFENNRQGSKRNTKMLKPSALKAALISVRKMLRNQILL